MARSIRLILSTAAIIAGLAVAGLSYSTQGVQAQQASCLPATATEVEGVIAAGNGTAEPTATCTVPPVVRTATPTPTKTVPATNTPVPPTEAPATNTPVPPPPTATQAGGGVGGQGVQPPNTGSGPDARSVNWLALAGGLILVLAGGTSLTAATRRRR
jgi:hypothetical protein